MIISIPSDNKPLVAFRTPEGIHLAMPNDERTGWGTVVFPSVEDAKMMLIRLLAELDKKEAIQ